VRPFAIPAMANVHSHAFQRDLRGVGERAGRPDDDFWSWREGMYTLAGDLDPAGMREVAERVYTEMAAAGYGAVGEFHYVHHRPDGTPYEEPNAMALAVAEAAAAAGLRLVLLPAAYHRGGHPRFRDASVDAFLARVDGLRAAGVDVGVAAHSVRAVPEDWLREIASYADAHGLVRHIHAHEQPRELAECRAEHGCSPIELLDRTGFLSDRTTVVHGIHVDERDVRLLAEAGAIVATCPTTEGNLGDGHFPALVYRDAGVRLAIGSDSNVVVDPFEEVRELETGARRERRTRHALLAAAEDLWGALCSNGLASLGLRDGGTVRVDLDHPRLRGVPEGDVMRALATCASADVVTGVVTGSDPSRRLVSSGSAFEEQIGYSRAVVDGEWVHVSGTTGFDYATMTISHDVVEQAAQCVANVADALAAAGCTFGDVVRVRYLLPDRADFEPCWPVLRRAFGAARPAATMQECGLIDPRVRIEIEVTARKR
jgi:formimidoylglutamate deiminase